MKRFSWVYLLCLLAGCTATEQAGEQSTTTAADSAVVAGRAAVWNDYDQLRGVWLNTKFEQALEKTKSPQKAVVDVPSISFFREEGKPVAFVNLGFREGITIPLDSLQRVGNELKHQEVTLLLSPDGEEITLQLADQARMKGKVTFRRLSQTDLPSMEAEHDTLMRYINRVVLAGAYRDRVGNGILVFTPEMTSYTHPGNLKSGVVKLPYELEMNVPVKGCDGLYYERQTGEKVVPPRYTGFAWRGKSLELYHVQSDPDNPDGLVREKKPFAKLTRTQLPGEGPGPTQ